MKRETLLLSATLATLLLGACSSNNINEQLPGWVLNPTIDNGLADTQCVNNNANLNILKSKATALARAEIVKQIDVKVNAMDKTYDSLTEAEGGSVTGSTFESVSKQVASQSIAGSRIKKVEYVNFPDETQKLCVMVTLAPEETEELFKSLVKASGKKLSAKSESVLYQEFKAHKAQQELEQSLN